MAAKSTPLPKTATLPTLGPWSRFFTLNYLKSISFFCRSVWRKLPGKCCKCSQWCFYDPGWLHKEVKTGAKSSALKLKKRWFVLTNNSLDYYKSSERNASKMGTLVLNSLCSVVQPDEKVFKDTGELIRQV